MSDQEVAVTISADVKSLLQGMKDAQEHTETAVSGMKGDLGDLIESFEKLGPAALALGAVGLAFEALKEGAAMTMEAVHATDELSRSFETLHMRTGASYQDITVYKNAMVLSGGSMEDFSSILSGLQRKMAASPEIYIANKIAADATALSQQDLMTTLAKSVQVLAAIEEPGRRSEMAIALLGGRAQAMLPQIMRMNEVIEKEGVEGLKKFGAVIDDEAVEKMKKLEHELGSVKLEIEKVDQTLAESGRGWAVWGAKLNLMWHQATLAASDYWRMAFPDLKGDEERRVAALQAQWKKEGALPEGGGEGGHTAPAAGGGGGVTPKELEARKAAAAQKNAMSVAAANEELKIAKWEVDESLKIYANQLKMGQITLDEYTEAARAAAQQVYEAEQAASAKKIALAQGDKAKIQAINMELSAAKRVLEAADQALDEKAKTHAVELEKELTEECLKLTKDYHKKKEAQEKAAEAITQKTEKETEKKFEAVINGMTNGWDVGIQKMLHGHMSLKDGAINALKQIEDQTEKTVINMGIQWLKDSALKQALALKDHFVANQEAAGTAAGNAWASAAEIPMVGWIIAPVAAAAAYAGVMAFAEGGWDRVPSDQVAMIHKNEMVLPAHIAEPVRQMAARGGGAGDIHFHGTSAGGFFVAHQSELIAALRSANRNGRIG